MKTSTLMSVSGLVLLLLMNGCDFFKSSSVAKSMGTNATGIAYEIIVVVDPGIWNDSVGTTIKKELIWKSWGFLNMSPQCESCRLRQMILVVC